MTIDPREVARWARIVSANRLICVRADDLMNCGDDGTHHGGADFCTPIGRLAEAFEDTHKDNRMDLLDTNPPPRQCAIPLLVELCAGTAALSLRLERDGARPPVSRMGAKTGYADAILALAGLNPGDKAEHYFFCEPDDGVRLLLHAYRDADLAREAAAIIRSWVDEEPRALWERLRAEGPARCPPVDAREVGRAFQLIGCSRTGQWAEFFQGWTTPLDPPAVRFLGARRVADYVALYGRYSDGRPNGPRRGHPLIQSPRVESLGGLPATIHDDATTAPVPIPVPPGTLAYMDGPYENTTGYSHLFPRSEQVKVARRWANAGARVMISEAVPIEELTAEGWHAVEITAMRVGQKRTFSRQQQEWVTMSFEPDARAVRACEIATERADRTERVMAGGEQVGLFGGDR